MAVQPSIFADMAKMAQLKAMSERSKTKVPWMQQPGMLGIDRGTWLGIGASLMGNARGGNWGDALAGAAGAMQQQDQRRQGEQQSEAKRRALALMQMGDTQGALKVLAQAPGLEDMALEAQMRPAEKSKLEPYTLNPGDIRYGPDNNVVAQNPTVERDISSEVHSTFTAEDGSQYMVMKNGRVVPSGQKAANPYQITQFGDVPTAVDRRTGGTIPLADPSQIAANAGTVAGGVRMGEARADAAMDLGRVAEQAATMERTINSLVNSKGFDAIYGLQGKIPRIPGSQGADAESYLKQIEGQAFLQAFQQLKGGGAITEIEGQKATQAIARLTDRNMSPAEARRAAEELRAIVRNGLARARAKAGGAPQAPAAPQAPEGMDPEDWKYMTPQERALWGR